jgi:hypothetical protein
MNFTEIIEAARCITMGDICISRRELFNGIGRADPTGFEENYKGVVHVTDVVSARPSSIFNIVKEHVNTNISREECILAEHMALFDEGLLPPDSEALGWVEQHKSTTQNGEFDYKIVCVTRTRCGARFTMTKELMHIYSGTVKGKIGSANSLLKCATRWRSTSKDHEMTNVDPETAAFYQAIEVVIPWQKREQLSCLRSLFAGQGEQNMHMFLAKAFMIPVKIIEHIHDKGIIDADEPYCCFSERLNRNVN